MYIFDEFYTENGFKYKTQYGFLSNMFLSPIEVNYLGVRIVFPAAENAFQALKIGFAFMDQKSKLEWVQHMGAVTPSEAKRLGKILPININGWNSVSYARMKHVQDLKYGQNVHLAEQLKQTGSVQLIEMNHWGDKLWGVDMKTHEGTNYLGEILMDLRQQFIS